MQEDEAAIRKVSYSRLLLALSPQRVSRSNHNTISFFAKCSLEHVNNLREVQAMRRLNPHANVVDLKEIVL